MALLPNQFLVQAHVLSPLVVKGVAMGITQSFQFFGLHAFCPRNIWPQTAVGSDNNVVCAFNNINIQ